MFFYSLHVFLFGRMPIRPPPSSAHTGGYSPTTSFIIDLDCIVYCTRIHFTFKQRFSAGSGKFHLMFKASKFPSCEDMTLPLTWSWINSTGQLGDQWIPTPPPTFAQAVCCCRDTMPTNLVLMTFDQSCWQRNTEECVGSTLLSQVTFRNKSLNETDLSRYFVLTFLRLIYSEIYLEITYLRGCKIQL